MEQNFSVWSMVPARAWPPAGLGTSMLSASKRGQQAVDTQKCITSFHINLLRRLRVQYGAQAVVVGPKKQNMAGDTFSQENCKITFKYGRAAPTAVDAAARKREEPLYLGPLTVVAPLCPQTNDGSRLTTRTTEDQHRTLTPPEQGGQEHPGPSRPSPQDR